MEHCTTRFFETCDLDNDKYIALEEWAGCFGIKERECWVWGWEEVSLRDGMLPLPLPILSVSFASLTYLCCL